MNKKITIPVFAVLFLGSAIAQEAPVQADELTSLNQSYAKALEKAVFPIDVQYREDLNALKVELTKAGRLEEALQVESEINRLAGKPTKRVGEPSGKLEVLAERNQRAIDTATRPLTQTYLRHLEKLRTKYQKAGQLKETIAVETELDRINESIASNTRLSPSLDKLTEKALIGTKWIYPYVSRPKGKGEMLLEFKESGKANVKFRKVGGDWEQHLNTNWSIVGDWTLKAFLSGFKLTVSKDLEKMTWAKDITAVRYREN